MVALRIATATEKHPETWLERVEREGTGLVEEEVLTAEAEGDEFLLMGLRLKEGIDLGPLCRPDGPHPRRRANPDARRPRLARASGSRLAVTRRGFPVLDAVVADLAA